MNKVTFDTFKFGFMNFEGPFHAKSSRLFICAKGYYISDNNFVVLWKDKIALSAA